MDVRFRGKSGRAADIIGTTESDPERTERRPGAVRICAHNVKQAGDRAEPSGPAL